MSASSISRCLNQCFSSSFRASVMKIVRQEDAVLVFFRTRTVLLPSRLSSNSRRMQSFPVLASDAFWTRCIDLLMVNVPMPSAASKLMSSGVSPATSPSRSAPTSVRWTARCKIGSSMLASAACISPTSQMERSCVDFLGLSTGTGLLMRMPHSTA